MHANELHGKMAMIGARLVRRPQPHHVSMSMSISILKCARWQEAKNAGVETELGSTLESAAILLIKPMQLPPHIDRPRRLQNPRHTCRYYFAL